jgi:hypothetical protein
MMDIGLLLDENGGVNYDMEMRDMQCSVCMCMCVRELAGGGVGWHPWCFAVNLTSLNTHTHTHTHTHTLLFVFF